MKNKRCTFVYVNKTSDELIIRNWHKIKEHIINLIFYSIFIFLLFIDYAYSNVLFVSIILTVLFPCHIFCWLKMYRYFIREDYNALSKSKTIYPFVILMFVVGNIFWFLSALLRFLVDVRSIVYLFGLFGLLLCYVNVFRKKQESFFLLSFVFSGMMQSAFMFLMTYSSGRDMYIIFGWGMPQVATYEALYLNSGLNLLPFIVGVVVSICIFLFRKQQKKIDF